MPNTWPLVQLGELLTPVSRPEMVDADKTYRILGAHWYAQGLYVKDTTTGAAIQAKSLYRVEEGDFVYNRLFAWKGSFALATKENSGCYVSNEFPCFGVNRTRLDGCFLWRFFSRSSVWDDALSESTGGTPTSRNRLKERIFLAFKIPLPHLHEQQRIVACIEQLAAKIQEARHLKSEVRVLTDAMLEAAKRNTIGDLGANPFAWPTSKLRHIAETRYGISAPISGATDENLGTPILRMANIALDGSLDLTDLRYYPMNEREKSEFLLQPGDLLLNWRSGSSAHVGKTALFQIEDGEYTFASFLLRIRAHRTQASPEYLKLILNFMRSEGMFLEAQRFQVNTKLNAEEFGNFEVLLPPLQEQRRIVTRLDNLQAKVDALRKLQAETAAELDALLPSVLDRAFKGEL